MRLAKFILDHIEPILVEWEAFARSIWPNRRHTSRELRDHAEAILRATAADMGRSQTPHEQAEKSKGHSDHLASHDDLNEPSAEHGTARGISGLNLPALISEYRALRASVLRLWRASVPDPHALDLDDITRFNESIDQSIAHAVLSYNAGVERSRQMFLAILGHDLRNPLNAIKMSAAFLERALGADPQWGDLTRGIVRSADHMNQMILGLLDFTSTDLGGSLPVQSAAADLHDITQEVIDETRRAHPGANLILHREGDLRGTWDAVRLRQLLANLLGNAIQHGDAARPIELRAEAEDRFVRLDVINQGTPIPPHLLNRIFDPLTHGSGEAACARPPAASGSASTSPAPSRRLTAARSTSSRTRNTGPALPLASRVRHIVRQSTTRPSASRRPFRLGQRRCD